MKLRTLWLMGALVGALAVIGCGDDGGGTAGTGGGTAGTGGGSGDACDQLLPRCDNCTGDLAQEACRDLVNDSEVDECTFLLEADPGGCPFEI